MFQEAVGRLKESERGNVMEIVTSWMEEGIEQGAQRERSLILRQLNRRVGELPESVRSQIDTLPINQLEELAEALLDFSNLSNLEVWLAEQKR